MSCETAGREIASMEGEIVHHSQGGGLTVPAIIADAGEGAAERFIEFFTANIRNPNTRAAYAQADRTCNELTGYAMRGDNEG
jgi:hypothetical protein